LVVGVSRQDIEELGVEPVVNGSVDLVLATFAREGTAKGSDSGLGKRKETGWVDNNIAKGVAFATEEVVGVVSHGGNALVVGKLDDLGLLDFGCFLGVRELAAGLGMYAFGGFELAIGLLGRELGLGGGSLETGCLGSVGVGGGHGRRRGKKEELGGKGTRERETTQLKIALVCEKDNTRESEGGEGHQRGGQERNASCRWMVTEGRINECS